MEKLDTWGVSDNTVLIFMSDNGKSWVGNNTDGDTFNAGMKGFKGTVHEGGTRVPFFIRWPGKFSAGRKIEDLQNHYDILPTLADIADIDISDIPNIDGQSFLPYLENESYKAKDRYRFIHVGRWLLNPENISKQEINNRWIGTEESSNPDNYKYKNCAVRNELYRYVNNSELYDLFNDPGQTTNVAIDYPEVVEQMRQAYDEWWSNIRPLMVNENAPLAKEKPFWIDYKKQKELAGVKEWVKPNLD